jgi:hypothetical protein
MTTWSKTPEQMGIQPCEVCGNDTSFGSGRFVNRIPCDDNYMCEECLIEIEKEFEVERDKEMAQFKLEREYDNE